MKMQFGKPTRKDKPGARHKLAIQERTYKSISDMKRAKTQIYRRAIALGVGFNLFCNGQNVHGDYVLYFARCWTPAEITAAGFDPATF